MAEHWFHRQLQLGQRATDTVGTHKGELIVEGFPLGSEVTQNAERAEPNYGDTRFKVVGYYRGNVVLEGAKGTTHQATPGHLRLVE